jgi:hypothetical protein
VLTRFNVDIGPHRRTWDVPWLEGRFELFRSWCLPSMQAQTSQDFTWLVFFAARSRELVEPFLDALPTPTTLQPVFTDERFSAEVARDAVVARYDGRSTTLLTTRLDCDDALRSDVVARVRAAARPGCGEVLNLPLGYQVDDGRFHIAYDPANAFCTLVEPWDGEGSGVRTVHAAQHQDLASVAPIRQLGWEPSWLQVVHEDNLANHVNGLRVPRRAPRRRFAAVPAVAALPPTEHPVELVGGMIRTAVRMVHRLATHPGARRRVASLLRLPGPRSNGRIG